MKRLFKNESQSNFEYRKFLYMSACQEAFENDELLDLISEQSKDDNGYCKGEFLGGNGQEQWHHVTGKSKDVRGIDTDDMPPTEDAMYQRASLRQVVESHQDSIEDNGIYNVRQLRHWKGGFNGDKFAARQGKLAKQHADHGVKIDRRRKVGKRADMLKDMRRNMSNAEYRREVKRLKAEGIL